MTIMEAIEARHSVRSYKPVPIQPEAEARLRAEIDACNKEGGLSIQLVTGDMGAFGGVMARKFDGVRGYVALIGPRTPALEEKAGYYGERIALLAQTLGLNTCWVALTYSKEAARRACRIGEDQRLVLVLAVGYGRTQGVPHRSKTPDQVSQAEGDAPMWFREGVRAVLLAPTAINQQSFRLVLEGSTVEARALGGFYSKVDLGIVRYHFEIGAGKGNFTWKGAAI